MPNGIYRWYFILVAREKGKIAQTSHIRKLQNKEVTNDDPLSALK